MGEAKQRRLARQLGETRGDGFDAFLDQVSELRATPGARQDQLDRLKFHELFSVALVEGCRAQGGEAPTAQREFELIEASSMAAGVAIAATFLGRFDSPPDAVVETLANNIMQRFAEGVMIAAQSARSNRTDTAPPAGDDKQ